MFSAYLLRALGSDLCVVERSSRQSKSKEYIVSSNSLPFTEWGGRSVVGVVRIGNKDVMSLQDHRNGLW